jgi:hypothetical protein
MQDRFMYVSEDRCEQLHCKDFARVVVTTENALIRLCNRCRDEYRRTGEVLRFDGVRLNAVRRSCGE